MPQDTLLDWYQRLSSRTVDLIGDYAGNELFLVEGDSLILTCLDTPDIDLDGGFQLLHAIHAIESFLAALIQRKSNFHIVFFHNHSHLSVPTSAIPSNAYKYTLIRAVIIRHLSENLPKLHPTVLIREFAGYEDPLFINYMSNVGLYFAMCHDGASSSPFMPASVLRGSALAHDAQRLAFRRMISWFVQHGLNIALTNSVDWKDTKVMAIVLEGSRRSRSALDLLPKTHLTVDPFAQGALVSDVAELLSGLDTDVSSETLCLVHCASKLTLETRPSETDLVLALVISAIIARHIPVAHRRFTPVVCRRPEQMFLAAFSANVCTLLRSTGWLAAMASRGASCDIADMIDGRLFYHVTKTLHRLSLDEATLAEVRVSLSALVLNVPNFGTDYRGQDKSRQIVTRPTSSLLPFSNPVFDAHLASIHVEAAHDELRSNTTASRTFRELTHWHNTKPIAARSKVATEWQRSRLLRAHQMFLREMQAYAASLTSSVGKSLDPEIIFSGNQNTDSVAISGSSASAAKAANAARLFDKNRQRFIAAWQVQLKELDKINNLQMRYIRTQSYLQALPKERSIFLKMEIEVYMIDCLLRLWHAVCKQKKQGEARSARFAALLLSSLNTCQQSGEGMTRDVRNTLQLVADSLGLPVDFSTLSQAAADYPLSFRFFLTKVDRSLHVPGSALLFQLEHCGPYLDRSFKSAPDPRVRFEPDEWQRRVLDLIDQKTSVFVVAPTSAGKTFISFYAMKQVLRESDNGVLVYVAPMKALVNQIAAELQAQFSKNYKYPGTSVWAIHTRDYRVNDPQGCQILVTVPHILQIMLLAPTNAQPSKWSTRVRRIIFDEIHSIGQADDGVVWEQLLLLAPCPIIALSATVGNPHEFFEWMHSTQTAIGNKMEMVRHPFRYSDLRKFIYAAPKEFEFQQLSTDSIVGLPSLDDAPGMLKLHPVASLINESRGIPDDLYLEPRDCLSLWKCMKAKATDKYPLADCLDPTVALPPIVRKVDTLRWEAQLKAVLKTWMSDVDSPFRSLIDELSKPIDPFKPTVSEANSSKADADTNDLLTSTMPLLSTLNAQNALPAILFNYDRQCCEAICQRLIEELDEAQTAWKQTSPAWKLQIQKHERWIKEQEKNKSKKPSAKKVKSKGDDSAASKAEQEREAAEAEQNPLASFDPDGILDGFSFANNKVMHASEFAEIEKKLKWRQIPPYLIQGLRLGIGIHHAGMNRAYRQTVETLFRRGFLRVVIATGTLALGINMPCKTVVFSGDSIFLTALNFRQAAGRAGRRGFDLLGNVVFQNIPRDKIFRLVSSRLPDLNGHFPITTSLVLRLFVLLHESNGSRYAKTAINSLLSQPRLYLGGENFRDQVLHHLRYSVEYLRRQHLIGAAGEPLNFAGVVSHLYYTESSSFAFHCLLKDGYFNRLCAEFVVNGDSEQRIMDRLMVVMAHLFGRRFCRRADQEFVDEVVKKHSSCVFLPRMPTDAETCLRRHNAETLSVFSNYVKTFTEQHAERLGADDTLPLTKIRIGGKELPTDDLFIGHGCLPPVSVRSAFSALSGHGDEFATISELCRNVRSGVWLEEAAIPHVALYPDETQMPLNAYLYDFYKHGDLKTLEIANGIRRGDIWFLLNDFSLVLATIVTSFKSFMNISDDTDAAMTELAGAGDMNEVNEDERVAQLEHHGDNGVSDTKAPGVGINKSGSVPKASKSSRKKELVAESWEDDEGDEDSLGDETKSSSPVSEAGKHTRESNSATCTDAANTPSWEEDDGESLIKVALAFEALKKSFDGKFKKMWA